MKLVTFLGSHGRDRLGAIIGPQGDEHVLDLATAAHRDHVPATTFRSMLTLIEAGPRALDQVRSLAARHQIDEDIARPLARTRLRAPIPVPPQVRDFSVFPRHLLDAPVGMRRIIARARGDEAAALALQPADEVPQVYRDRPIYYFTNRFSIVGPDTDVVWPSYSTLMDYELEVAAVLWGGGSDIPAKDAHAQIFGYTIFNDFSARDAQLAEMAGMLGPAKGKSFDAGNALGPYILTSDEMPDPYALKATAQVNGETWTDSSTAGMLHSFEDMIAYVSRAETLMPGEIFGSGTVNGGCGLEHDRFLKPGDMVELSVDGLGTLRNRVLASQS
ncbi:fumarylacetoacetate hydrolase family protein [Phreatobacter sp.]|uniref:fumarylacetoacetate hydrolase family protein n=1 Tax=Phreatobacter sp. TaxID=1966341 RepID=UPI0022BE26A8|nr:fumarylacetoacetate hydrolase family protein [Phreatobacter sp.]MCZ8316519.1 fumarylacetoacetate hydrolase family protein [Phreatobacter sp.]